MPPLFHGLKVTRLHSGWEANLKYPYRSGSRSISEGGKAHERRRLRRSAESVCMRSWRGNAQGWIYGGLRDGEHLIPGGVRCGEKWIVITGTTACMVLPH